VLKEFVVGTTPGSGLKKAIDGDWTPKITGSGEQEETLLGERWREQEEALLGEGAAGETLLTERLLLRHGASLKNKCKFHTALWRIDHKINGKLFELVWQVVNEQC
jgi:hypothetical protein